MNKKKHNLMKNKKGNIFIWIIGIAIVTIIASLLGLLFINKLVDNLASTIQSKWVLWGAVFILLIIFRKFIEAVLMSIWAGIKTILK